MGRILDCFAGNCTGRNAAAMIDEPRATFPRGWGDDLVRLASMIERARRGDASALAEVRQIAARIHGKSSALGANHVSASAEAIGQLTSKILDDIDAHGPIAESALLGQLSEFIDGLATASGSGERGDRVQTRRARAGAGPPTTLPSH